MMRLQRRWWTWECISVAVIAWGLVGVNVQAQEGLKLGPVEIHPSLTIQETYDDNIFLEESEEEADFITNISPTLEFVVPLRRHRFRLSYAPGVFVFGGNSEENFVSHQVGAELALNFPLGLGITLSERYLETSLPSSSEEQSSTGEARFPRRQNDIGLVSNYSVSPKTEIELTFLHTDFIFDQEDIENRNRNENTVTLTFFYRILPTMSTLLSYGYKRTDFVDLEPEDLDKGSQEHNASVGVRFDPAAKLRGRITVGFAIKDFDTNTRPAGEVAAQPGTPALEALDDELAITTATALTWDATPKTTFDLEVSRDFQESSTVEASSFNAMRVTLGITEKFSDILSATIRGAYERDDFNALDRSDDIWQASTVVQYDWRTWLGFELGYEHVTKRSDDDTIEYDVNRFWLLVRGQL